MSTRGSRKYEQLPEIPIAEVIKELTGEEVRLGSGWLSVRCPFHSDRTASARVNHDKNAFTCNACGTEGDSLALLMRQRGLSFRQALELGKQLAGIESDRPRKRTRRVSDLL